MPGPLACLFGIRNSFGFRPLSENRGPEHVRLVVWFD